LRSGLRELVGGQRGESDLKVSVSHLGKVGDCACRSQRVVSIRRRREWDGSGGRDSGDHGFSEPDSTPTPWAAGLEQLRAADTFWLSTVRPDG
jgi:hypothetical protein